MKKMIIFLIIFISFIPFITDKNDYKDITTVNYISSIGIDYDKEKDEFIVYSYILNNLNLASNTSSPGDTETMSYIIKNKNKNFSTAFMEIKRQTNINLYYTHLESVILSVNFINRNNIELFYTFIKDSIEIYPTFYLFTTDSKIEDIFNIKYLTDISGYHTLLVNPTLSNSHQFVTFIDFAKLYLKDNFTLLIPHIISIEDIFYQQNKSSNLLEIDGYTIISPDFTYYNFLEIEEPNIKWLKKLENQYLKLGDYNLYIKECDYSIKKKQNTIVINYQISSIITQNIDNTKYIELEKKLTELVKIQIKDFITKTISLNIDIYNFKYLCNLNNINPDNVDVKIKFKVN